MDSQHNHAGVAPDFKRRTVITAIAAALGVATIGLQGPLANLAFAADAAAPLASFVRLSEFSTHRKLDPILAERYYTALKKRNAGFDTEVAAALAQIDAAKPADIDAFLAVIDPVTRTTVTGIVTAWYMGFVGSGKDVELISYAEALMYEPARGILVVPSYGGGPNSWGEKPV